MANNQLIVGRGRQSGLAHLVNYAAPYVGSFVKHLYDGYNNVASAHNQASAFDTVQGAVSNYFQNSKKQPSFPENVCKPQSSMSGLTAAERARILRAGRYETARVFRDAKKALGPSRRAVLRAYADGSTGYGAYRRRSASRFRRRIVRRRRGSSRRGYGAYVSGFPVGGSVMDQDVPQISNPRGSDGAVVIQHKEYIRDIPSTVAFALQANLRINPGDANTFPWLSSIAKSFTQYRFEGLIFKFVSTSGSLSTTQALGEIIQAVNYNPVEPTFTNKQQMLNEIFSISKVPAIDSECPVECEPAQSQGMGFLTVRNGSESPSVDPRFYDLGQYYLATQGQAVGAVTMGELHVTYQVALYKPQLQYPAVSMGTQVSNTLTIDPLFPATPQNLFPESGTVVSINTFGCTFSYGATPNRTRVTIPNMVVGYNYTVQLHARTNAVYSGTNAFLFLTPWSVVSGAVNYPVNKLQATSVPVIEGPDAGDYCHQGITKYSYTATSSVVVIDFLWPFNALPATSPDLTSVFVNFQVQPCTL